MGPSPKLRMRGVMPRRCCAFPHKGALGRVKPTLWCSSAGDAGVVAAQLTEGLTMLFPVQRNTFGCGI